MKPLPCALALSLALLAPALLALPAQAKLGLEGCESHFPDGTLKNAPAHAPGHEMAGKATLLCKDFGEASFFALAYNEERRASDWVAYRLSVEQLGPKACRTKSRKDWRVFHYGNPRTEKFFRDADLKGAGTDGLLSGSSYRGTRFDRGHQAPGAAFGWHACGWYRTFTMANMSPQRPNLNQKSWQKLEDAVRFWAVELGEIYVVTGPFYERFPAKSFAPFKDGGEGDFRHIETPGLAIERNGADIPTGSYKVVFAPASGERPARALGFLLPNSSQLLPWTDFALPVEALEGLTKLSFGLPPEVKGKSDLEAWPLPDGKWVERPCADGSLPVAPAAVEGNPEACLAD